MKGELIIMQGDQYPIDLTIDIDGDIVTSDDVKTIEMLIGNLRKVYPGDATYTNGCFSFPLSQQETFAFAEGTIPIQVRVALKNAPEVIGCSSLSNGYAARVVKSYTREVL